MALVVGLDIGTQGAKALVFDTIERRVVSRGSAGYDIIKSDVPGRAEQHPSIWIEARTFIWQDVRKSAHTAAATSVCQEQGGAAAISAALDGKDASRVKAIGVSGQQHGLVPLDADGQVQGLLARHRSRPPCAPMRSKCRALVQRNSP